MNEYAKNLGNLNQIDGLCHCPYSGCDIVLQFFKISSLRETE